MRDRRENLFLFAMLKNVYFAMTMLPRFAAADLTVNSPWL
jgi:hypothetical protein